jgi:protein AaeX
MRFTELDLLGVYVAPIALMMLIAWLLLLPLRRLADRYGLLQHVWHPALFSVALYVSLLACIILVWGRLDF